MRSELSCLGLADYYALFVAIFNRDEKITPISVKRSVWVNKENTSLVEFNHDGNVLTYLDDEVSLGLRTIHNLDYEILIKNLIYVGEL